MCAARGLDTAFGGRLDEGIEPYAGSGASLLDESIGVVCSPRRARSPDRAGGQYETVLLSGKAGGLKMPAEEIDIRFAFDRRLRRETGGGAELFFTHRSRKGIDFFRGCGKVNL